MKALRHLTTQVAHGLLALMLLAQIAEIMPHHHDNSHEDHGYSHGLETDEDHHHEGAERHIVPAKTAEDHEHGLCALCTLANSLVTQGKHKPNHPILTISIPSQTRIFRDRSGADGHPTRGPPTVG